MFLLKRFKKIKEHETYSHKEIAIRGKHYKVDYFVIERWAEEI